MILFFLWLLTTGWIHSDAGNVEAKENYWTGIFLGVGIAAAIIWMLIPIFIIGMLLFLIASGAVFIAYLRHRDTLVMDYDRILTTDGIRELFGTRENKLEELKKQVEDGEAEVVKWKASKKENVEARVKELLERSEKFHWD